MSPERGSCVFVADIINFMTFELFLFVALGLAGGSFANAAAWRIKTERSFVNERSICPSCEHGLSWYELIPVFSWVALGGKCKNCKKSISIQYPLIEIAGGLTYGLSWIVLSPESSIEWIAFVAWLILLVWLLVLFVYDLRWYLLPNKITYPLAVFVSAILLVQLVLGLPFSVFLAHVLSGLGAWGFFYGLYAFSGGKWMGGGDSKLALPLGLALGWPNTMMGLMLAFFIGAFVSVGLLASKLATRKSMIPFGPFIIGGCVLGMLYGEQILAVYSNFIFGV